MPFTLPDDVHPDVRNAVTQQMKSIVDLNQAIVALKTQVDAKTQVITKVTTTSSSGGTPSPPTPFPFPGLGGINDQTGNTTYTVASTDNGIFMIFGAGSAVTLTLNSALGTPYFFFATNFGSSTVTMSPTTGSINQATLPVGGLYLVAFNGTNWKASAIIVAGATYADAETPSGTINSSNVTFTLAHTPNPSASLEIYYNGLLQAPAGADYTLATATITFVSAPVTGSVLLAFYRY
jgi:hypothetical protein